ncbi:hypothetical protein PsorP6_013274 [Peronosclerospora sorghi]|uniref:Uncharacterized protein n=1 Tax=Peronosclerospora sorghi TaxID=230839 RepID=A0ACC0WFH0_9STRA|nr:hypothetical protein PsorP6_013274 [Peronosclerospora sorghi]
MRIDLILLLASSAHLTGNNCLAVAAGSEHPTTQNKATIESVDENRVTTSERSLRVRATRDEEDEERVSGASVEKMSSKVMQFVMKSLSSKEDKALKTIDRLFPEPSGGNLETNYAALKEGLENTEMVNKLVKSHPDLLFETLTTRFKDLYLPRALVEMASKKGAAESVKTLRDKQMDRLVEKGMTPDLFVDTLGFTSNGKMGPYGFESLDEFLKAYKRVKPKAPPVNIGEVLVSKPSLARERHISRNGKQESCGPGGIGQDFTFFQESQEVACCIEGREGRALGNRAALFAEQVRRFT